MKIDLNDPKTKALFEYYGAKKEKDFKTAYLYMKYLDEFVSLVSQGYGLPPIQEIAQLDPDVLQKLYVKLGDVALGFGSNDTSVYHSKVIKLENAEKLVTQKIDVHLDVPETVVPFKLAKDVILHNPDSIAVGLCPCRNTNPESSCIPDGMEACMFLGDPYASFIAEHNPKFRKVSQEEAVGILKECHERGFVHCAYFKKDMGNRLYAICNCCSCCCVNFKANQLLKSSGVDFANMVPSGYVAVVGEDCTGCEECVEYCAFDAISMVEDESIAQIDPDLCMGCGVCESKCTTEDITLQVDASKGGILDIDEYENLATP